MHPQLQTCLDEITAAVAGATDEQARTAPEGKWTPLQVLEHLALACVFSARGIKQGANSGAPAKWEKKPSLLLRLARITVLGLGKIPSGRQAPKFSIPKTEEPPQQLAPMMEKFRHALELLDGAITAAEQKPGPSIAVSSHPILGPFSAKQWCRFHLVHTRHHLKQIRERLKP